MLIEMNVVPMCLNAVAVVGNSRPSSSRFPPMSDASRVLLVGRVVAPGVGV